MNRIYMDHAATTPVREEVLAAMDRYFSERFGNPSSLHSLGQQAAEGLRKAREQVAAVINAEPGEIIFTSGGTESNNLALKGVAFANRSKGKHIILSKIEHPCVMEAAAWLERNGFYVTRLRVDRYGMVDPNDVDKAIRKDTILVSVMHANNEIGTIEPIEEIAKICDENNVLFHTDAVQSFGKVRIDVKKMKINLLTASSHKIYGPKGVGCLFVKTGTPMEPLLHGGGQERNLRSGTENVAGIVGFGKAAELAAKEIEKESARLKRLRDLLIKGVLQIDDSFLNGHPRKRLPGNAHFGFRFIEGESLLMMLDAEGIAVSTGSACSSKSLEASHVLLATGLRHEEAHGSLRFTLGRSNDEKQIRKVVEILPRLVQRLRRISPLRG